MSVKVIPYFNQIVNSNNQKIYNFPANTVLDNILPDLWSKIIEYYYHHKTFAFGTEKTKKSNYRQVGRREFKTAGFKKLFSECYFGYNGLHCLSNLILTENPILYIRSVKNGLVINSPKQICLKLDITGKVNEDDFVLFSKNDFTENELETIDCIRRFDHGLVALLFIKKGIYLY